jgi:uncharacterized membrane protein
MKTIAISALMFALLGTDAALAEGVVKRTKIDKETIIKESTTIEETTQGSSEKFLVRICNNSDSKMNLAVGYPVVDAVDNDWAFEGWHILARGQCYSRKVEAEGRTELRYTFHANAYKDGSWMMWGKGTPGIKLPSEEFSFTRYEKYRDKEKWKENWPEYTFSTKSAFLGKDNTQNLTN